jgi:hypothetical protein
MAAGERVPARRLRMGAGLSSTTLTVGNEVNSPDGTPVTVLVDPQDPAHAEYPGRPTYPPWVPIMFLCFTGVSTLLFIFGVWRLAVIRFRNRRLPPPPVGRHRNQRGTRARSRVGGLPAIGDRGAGPDAVGGGAAADGRKVPRQWVVAPEAEEGVAALAEMVARSPQAPLVLGQVLRATETLPVLAALDVESFAYSMLLGGKEFGHWLSGNEDREPPPLVDEPVLVKREEKPRTSCSRSSMTRRRTSSSTPTPGASPSAPRPRRGSRSTSEPTSPSPATLRP